MIRMRYTRADRIKWVRMMGKIRTLCRETGGTCRITTRRLADGVMEGEIRW